MTEKDQYAVFGCPIKHSKSPEIHRLFAEQTRQSLEYTAKEVPAESFKASVGAFFAQGGGKGLNCTLPLKELAWAYADQNTVRANLSKAVNTLSIEKDGSILGDNTDGCGLINDLVYNNGVFLKNAKILILGAGGASRGIIAPILEYSPEHLVITNRTPERAMTLADEFSDFGKIIGCGFAEIQGRHQFDLIINATSASLYDELPPLSDDLLVEGGACYDLAYGKKPTSFVRWGVARKAKKSLDGLGMLVEQAAEAFFLWRGIRPQTKPVIAKLNSLRQSV